MLEREERMLAALVAMAGQPQSSSPSQSPRSPGVKDKVGDMAIEIADTKERIRFMREQLAKNEQPIKDFINGVTDAQMRMILLLRFTKALTWREVAGFIGGGNTKESVKTACYRYLS